MKKRNGFRLICIFIVVMFVFTACGAKKDTASEPQKANDGGANYGDVSDFTSNENEAPADGKGDVDTSNNGTDSGVKATEVGYNKTQDKIIYKYQFNVETKDFDKLLDDVQTSIKNMGGYTENSKIGGKSYDDSNVERNGSILARIPTNKAEEFISFIKKESNVIDSQQTSENVSLQYVDTQSRIDTLKIEQERLYDILKETKELDNIITLETRLSDIRYELEKNQSQLRLFDNQVEFSYVTLNIQEVRKITPPKVVKPTFFSRISDGLSNTFENVSNGFQSFLVWFIVNLPYFIIWGVILLVLGLIARHFYKKETMKYRRVNAEAIPNRQPGGQPNINPQSNPNSTLNPEQKQTPKE